MPRAEPAGVQLAPAVGARVVVVGGCGGIGRAFVAAALATGLDIAVLDLPQSLDQFPPPDGVRALPCDATDETSVSDAFAAIAAEWPSVDAVVDLVGYTNGRVNIEEMPTAMWDDVVAGTLRSAYLVSRAAVPLLRKADAGALVLTASTFGVAVRYPGYGPYAAAKAGVVNLVRALAVECAPVRVNALAPGLVDTDFIRGGTGRAQREAQIDRDAVAAALPMGRVAEPADMAGPLLYLIGPASAYMTAQTLHVNGGLWS